MLDYNFESRTLLDGIDADTEAELRDCFIKLKGMLEKAAKPNAVDELLIKRGKKKTKKSTGGLGCVVCLGVAMIHHAYTQRGE
jgi:hypothetical protein